MERGNGVGLDSPCGRAHRVMQTAAMAQQRKMDYGDPWFHFYLPNSHQGLKISSDNRRVDFKSPYLSRWKPFTIEAEIRVQASAQGRSAPELSAHSLRTFESTACVDSAGSPTIALIHRAQVYDGISVCNPPQHPRVSCCPCLGFRAHGRAKALRKL